MMTLLDRFEAKYEIIEPGGCWIWTGGLDRDGYGKLSTSGKHGVPRLAHRVSWELYRGPIPKNICVLHHCDNRPCVNPAHLFLGTRFNNNTDMTQKGRGKYIGELNGQAKLTTEDIIKIRASSGVMLHREIAMKFQISRRYVGQIINYKKWRHVT